MSEYRHFQSESGYIHSHVAGALTAQRYDSGKEPYLTEVKVVPLDAEVIEGPLPEVTVPDTIRRDAVRVVGHGAWTRAYVKENFRAMVAAHRWFEQHPPADEEQVKAVVGLLNAVDPNPHDWYKADSEALREAVRRGLRVVDQ